MRTPLTIPQGTSWGISWPVTENGEAAAIDAWTVKAQIRSTPTSPTVLHEWSTEAGNATTEGSAVTLLLNPASSTAWTWKRGVYDVELISPDGTVYRIAEGAVYVSPEVTR
ncbi:hypothetical protein [Amycolatopsis kentuckyensis]|uniref:hypothetical protein n=1 Tax=Amycolatopsis kentuckyensis TaxID=218823 RepID=UPI0035680D76